MTGPGNISSDNALSAPGFRSAWLVKKAKVGSKTAFQELVHLYRSAAFRMVYYRIRSQMDAEDLTQDIFLQAFKNLNRLKQANSFRSWLYRIALNRVHDFHRKKRFRAMFTTSSDKDDPMECELTTDDESETLEQLARKNFWNRIREMLNQLSPMEREVFLLRFFDNLSIIEITEAVGKTESTVKTHLYRALNKFRNNSSIQTLLDHRLQ